MYYMYNYIYIYVSCPNTTCPLPHHYNGFMRTGPLGHPKIAQIYNRLTTIINSGQNLYTILNVFILYYLHYITQYCYRTISQDNITIAQWLRACAR